jgi:hypothetical protein
MSRRQAFGLRDNHFRGESRLIVPAPRAIGLRRSRTSDDLLLRDFDRRMVIAAGYL